MATPLPAPHCLQVTLHWTYNGIAGTNRWQVHYSGVWNATDVNTMLGDLVNRWGTHMSPILGDGFTTTEWTAIDLADPLHAEVIHPNTDAGHVSGDQLPNNVTMDVYWPVSSRVRGGRSHSFLTGFPTAALAALDPLHWDASPISSVLAWALAHQGQINTTSYGALSVTELGVVHYHRAHAALNPPEFEGFGTPQVESAVHSRSRRLPR